MPKISVIIPAFNTEKYLEKCLESVLNQTFSDIEIICVNDSSTDNSLSILKEFSKKDVRLKIIEFKENKGASVARNEGIKLAKGEYIGFVDSDDFIDLDFYEKLYKKAKETDADIVKSNLIFENNPREDNQTPYHNLNEVLENKLLFNHIPTAIFKKSFLLKNNISFPVNLTSSEDTLFETLAGYYANKIEIAKNTFYHYQYNNQSLNNSEQYSFLKIENLIKSLEYITDFLNTINVDEKIYKKIIEHRYNFIVYMFCYKCNEIYKNIDTFKKLISNLKQKFRYEIKDENWQNVELTEMFMNLSIQNTPVDKTEKIPKQIFYIWFGDKKTPLANVCIENWRDNLKDFKIIEINEDSKYFDFKEAYNSCKWFKTVYDRKMWAYVSDYARCKVLYDYGGIYLDTDMTICKDITPLLNNKLFLGLEKPYIVSAGIIGSKKQHPLFKSILDFYQNEIFNSPLYVITHIITKFLTDLKFNDIKIYPEKYFYPFYGDETFAPSCIWENTYTIHWWNSSWRKEEDEFFLQNKHKIPLEKIDDSYKRISRIKKIITNRQQNV